jgi:hypothetical protein
MMPRYRSAEVSSLFRNNLSHAVHLMFINVIESPFIIMSRSNDHHARSNVEPDNECRQ